MIDDDHMGFVMADVSGKGVPAALLMMVSRVLIKSTMQNGKGPAETLKSVNNQLCEGNDADFFVTVWLAVLEISTGKGVAANAGHEHPALRRADGSYDLIVYKHSMPVGVMRDLPFREHEFQLNPGDSFFVYTDGVVEATEDAQPEQMLANISQDIDRFVDGAEQFDDITMLCFRYFGPSEES